VNIRPATMDDVPALVEMAERFYPLSPYPAIYGDMPRTQAAGLLIVMMQGMAEHGVAPGILLVADKDGALVGMLGMHIDAATFTPEVIAGEIVWWMEPEHRGGLAAMRLVRRAEQEAKARGATVSRMAVLGTSPAEASEILQRIGYTPTEWIHTKRLD
jgi:RimJ/RimL family protein N-acetyltransferase